MRARFARILLRILPSQRLATALLHPNRRLLVYSESRAAASCLSTDSFCVPSLNLIDNYSPEAIRFSVSICPLSTRIAEEWRGMPLRTSICLMSCS
ncbi:unnamed protein product [Urochloa humidicola]